MRGAIAKEDTFLRPKLKFLGIIGSKVQPTRTPKYLEPSVIGFCVK
jgi:hypothetical protein